MTEMGNGMDVSDFGEINTTGTLTLTSGDDFFRVRGAGVGDFDNVDYTYGSLDGGDGTNTLRNFTGAPLSSADGATFAVADSETVEGFTNISTGNLNLTGGGDVFIVTRSNTGQVQGVTGITYLNLNNVVGGLGDEDSVIFDGNFFAQTFTADATDPNAGSIPSINFAGIESVTGRVGDTFDAGASDFTVGAGVDMGLAVDGFGNVDTTGLLTLTENNDVFTVDGAGDGSFDDVNYTYGSLDGGLGENTLLNNTMAALSSADGVNFAGTVERFTVISTANLNLTMDDDVFTVTGNSAGSVMGVDPTYVGLSTVNAGDEGVDGDLVVLGTGLDPEQTFTANAADLEAGSVASINFTGIEAVEGRVDDTFAAGALEYNAETGVKNGINVTGFDRVSAETLNLTEGTDDFTVRADSTGTLDTLGITFSGLNTVNAMGEGPLGGDQVTLALSGQEFIARELDSGTVAGIEFNQIEVVDGGATDQTNSFRVEVLPGDDALAFDAGSGRVVSVAGPGLRRQNFSGPTIAADVFLTDGDDVFLFTGPNAGTFQDDSFAGLVNLFAFANGSTAADTGDDSLVGSAAAEVWNLDGVDQGSVNSVNFEGFENLYSGGTATDTFNFTADAADVSNSINATDFDGNGIAGLNFGVGAGVTGGTSFDLDSAEVIATQLNIDGSEIASPDAASFTLLNTGNEIATLLASNLDDLTLSDSLEGIVLGNIDVNSLSVSATGNISNEVAAMIDVENIARFSVDNTTVGENASIALGNQEDDSVNFGQLQVVSDGNTLIEEDSSTEFTLASVVGVPNSDPAFEVVSNLTVLSSGGTNAAEGNITDDADASITVTGVASFTARNDDETATIALGDSVANLDNFGQLQVVSDGDTSIQEDSSTDFTLASDVGGDLTVVSSGLFFQDEGNIRDDDGASIEVDGVASFTADNFLNTAGIELGDSDGNVTNFGQLQVISDGDTFIKEDSSTEFTMSSVVGVPNSDPALEVVSNLTVISSGEMNAAEGNITDDAAASITVTGVASFTADNDADTATIALGDDAGNVDNFGKLHVVSDGDAFIQEDSSTEFTLASEVGVTDAEGMVLVESDLTLISSGGAIAAEGSITDDGDADISVTGVASFTADNDDNTASIALGDEVGNDTNFGQLQVVSDQNTSIQEDSSTEFTLASVVNGGLEIDSAGDITDDLDADITVMFNASFTGDNIVIGNNTMEAASGMVSGNDSNFGTLTFAGDFVFFEENSTTTLVGISDAQDFRLVSPDFDFATPFSRANATETATFLASSGNSVGVGNALGDYQISNAELTRISAESVNIIVNESQPLSFDSTFGVSVPAALGEAGSTTLLAGNLNNVTAAGPSSNEDIVVDGLSFDSTEGISQNLRTLSDGNGNVLFTGAASEISPNLVAIASYRGGSGELQVDQNLTVGEDESSRNALLESFEGDVLVDANVSVTGDISVLAGQSVLQDANITAGDDVDVLARNGDITMQNGALTTANREGDIRYEAVAGEVTLGGLIASDDDVLVKADGDILDGGATHREIEAGRTQLISATGSVGSPTQTRNAGNTDGGALDVAVNQVAVQAEESVYLSNAGSVTIGSSEVDVDRVNLSGLSGSLGTETLSGGLANTGNFKLEAGGSISVTDQISMTNTNGVDAGMDVLLDARVGDVVLGQSVLAGSDVTVFASGNVDQNANIDAVAGGIDVDAGVDALVSAVSTAQSVSAVAGEGDIRYVAGRNIALEDGGQLVALGDGVRLDAGENITDVAGLSILAEQLQLVADGDVGFGDGTTANSNPLNVEVSQLATAVEGSVYLSETDGVTVGNTTVAVNRIGLDSSATLQSSSLTGGLADTGHFKLESGGAIAVTDQIGGGNSNGIDAELDVLLDAQGGNVVLDQSVLAGSNVTVLASGDVDQNANIDAVAGSIDVDAEMDANISAVSTAQGAGDIRYVTEGNISLQGLGQLVALDDGVRLDAGGNITDAAAVSVEADQLQLVAGSDAGFGDGTAANSNPLNVDVAELATNVTGSVYVSETDGVTVGNTTVAVNRIGLDSSVTPQSSSLTGGLADTGHFKLEAGGAISVTDQIGDGNTNGVDAGMDVLLDAQGGDADLEQSVLAGSNVTVLASGDVNQNANIDAVAGSIDVDAQIDANIAGVSTTGGTGDIRYVAGENISLQGQGQLVALGNGVRLDAGENITDVAALSIRAEQLQLVAVGDVGFGDGTAANSNPLNVEVSQLATDVDGSVYLSETDGVTVGNTTVAVNRIGLDSSVTPQSSSLTGGLADTGHFKLESGGAITVSNQIGSGNTNGVDAGLDVLLDAQGGDVVLNRSVLAGSDMTILASGNVDQNANIVAAAGSIDVDAGLNALVSARSTAQGTGDIRYVAGQDISIDGPGRLFAVGDSVRLEAGENITDAGTVSVQASQLQLVAGGDAGFGDGTAANSNPLNVTVDALATNVTGSVYVNEVNQVTVGNTTVAVNRIGLDSSESLQSSSLTGGLADTGHFKLQSGGAITVTDQIGMCY